MRYRELTKALAVKTLKDLRDGLTRESGIELAGLEKKFTEKQLAKFAAEFSDMIFRMEKKWKMVAEGALEPTTKKARVKKPAK